jgi:signal transduction histidine kinase
MTQTSGWLLPGSTAAGRAVCAVLYCLLVLCALPANGQANLQQSIYLEDPARALGAEQALSHLRAGEGVPLPNGRFNVGNQDSHFWLYLSAANDSSAEQTWLLDTGVPFRAALTTYLLRDRNSWHDASLVLQSGDTQPFADRASDAARLHSQQFTVKPGETVELLLDYRTRGSTYMPLSFKPIGEFDAEQDQQRIRAALFYTACLTMLLLMFLFGLALNSTQVLGYAVLFSLSLMFIAANEGYAYQYLWPDFPGWNQYAGLFLLFFSAGVSFLVARHAMDPDVLTPRRSQLLLILAILSICLATLCSTLPFTTLVGAGSLLLLLSYFAQVVTVASWLRAAVKRHLVSLASMLVIIPCIAAIIALSIIGFDLPDLVFEHAARAIFFFTVIATVAALIFHVMALRIEHGKTLEASLVAARRDAQQSRALLEAEQKYIRARELALQRKQQMATTSHDIRQPLTSLRAVLDSGSLELGDTEQETLRRSLDYIEDLSRPGDEAAVSFTDNDEVESYRADLLLHAVTRMFEGEAHDKGIHLRTVPCSALIDQQPMPLMRILINLTSNAIKHCQSGSVLLGCRRVGGGLRIDVIDTGPGIYKEDLEHLQQPYAKGEASQGEGLGLAICWQLAVANGLEMAVDSRVGRGTRFSVLVSAAGGAD